jgi:hypothetical protein
MEDGEGLLEEGQDGRSMQQGGVFITRGEEDGELVAAEAAYGGFGRDDARKTVGDGAEGVISGLVAEEVVDVAETVEADDDDGERLGASALDGLAQEMFNRAAAAESGEDIDGRLHGRATQRGWSRRGHATIVLQSEAFIYDKMPLNRTLRIYFS